MELSGVEAAVFGPVSPAAVEGWLDRLASQRLGAGLAEVLFRSGRVSAVYGLRLADERRVAVKVHRDPVEIDRLARTTRCQRLLADGGFPCPVPVRGPVRFEGRAAVVESIVDGGAIADAHRAAIRVAMAEALAWQVDLLRPVPAESLADGAPAWARYEQGPWPLPHDPLFDFSSTPAGYEWLDHFAARACRLVPAGGAATVIGHADWVCGNLRFDGDTLTAAYDWDSLAGRPEAVLVGLAAGAHTEGSVAGATAPSPTEVGAFLADYSAATRPFSADERRAAVAAAAWVIAYNARCGVGFPDRPGSPLSMLSEHCDDYLALSW